MKLINLLLKNKIALKTQLRNESYKEYLKIFKKGNRTIRYLPWLVCWDKLKSIYPDAIHEWVTYSYDNKPYGGIMNPDGTVIIHCRITYTANGKECFHNEYLPVKNYKRDPISNPTSLEMENTYRKTLAKGVCTMTGFAVDYWLD